MADRGLLVLLSRVPGPGARIQIRGRVIEASVASASNCADSDTIPLSPGSERGRAAQDLRGRLSIHLRSRRCWRVQDVVVSAPSHPSAGRCAWRRTNLRDLPDSEDDEVLRAELLVLKKSHGHEVVPVGRECGGRYAVGQKIERLLKVSPENGLRCPRSAQ